MTQLNGWMWIDIASHFFFEDKNIENFFLVKYQQNEKFKNMHTQLEKLIEQHSPRRWSQRVPSAMFFSICWCFLGKFFANLNFCTLSFPEMNVIIFLIFLCSRNYFVQLGTARIRIRGNWKMIVWTRSRNRWEISFKHENWANLIVVCNKIAEIIHHHLMNINQNDREFFVTSQCVVRTTAKSSAAWNGIFHTRINNVKMWRQTFCVNNRTNFIDSPYR